MMRGGPAAAPAGSFSAGCSVRTRLAFVEERHGAAWRRPAHGDAGVGVDDLENTFDLVSGEVFGWRSNYISQNEVPMTRVGRRVAG